MIWRIGLLLWVLVLSSCSSITRSERMANDSPAAWSGRLQLLVDGNPPQQWTAAFELEGNPAQGRLTLLSPLGSTVADMAWSPAGAQLTDSTGHIERHPSPEHLLQARAGANVPLPALFGWLAGQRATVEGWTVDLSQYAAGRLTATRQQPAPSATLRIILDEPPRR